jgi:hypothetical protein
MLLGLIYKPEYGYYHDGGPAFSRRRYDAITIELLDREEVTRRQRAGAEVYYKEPKG